MNKPKFTEGQWSAKPVSTNNISIKCGRISVCDAWDINNIGHKALIANAHLIEAAPKMYAEIEFEIKRLQLDIAVSSNEKAKEYYKKNLKRKINLLKQARGEK